MLILTRRIGERVLIGPDIWVEVLGIKGNQVRLGLSAPDNVSIDREEVRDRKVAQGVGSARMGSSTLTLKHAGQAR